MDAAKSIGVPSIVGDALLLTLVSGYDLYHGYTQYYASDSEYTAVLAASTASFIGGLAADASFLGAPIGMFMIIGAILGVAVVGNYVAKRIGGDFGLLDSIGSYSKLW
ncbi:MAG: hypothetical protein ABSB29_02080 [Nitrososphaerales archaeon]